MLLTQKSMQNYTFFLIYAKKIRKKIRKICIFQKKAVLLQPICAESLAI